MAVALAASRLGRVQWRHLLPVRSGATELIPRFKTVGVSETLGALSLDAEVLAILFVNAADIVWSLSKAKI